MIELESIVVESSVVARHLNVGSLSNLIACEEIHKEEESELRSVPVLSVHILMVQEVRAEEQSKALKIGQLRVSHVPHHS